MLIICCGVSESRLLRVKSVTKKIFRLPVSQGGSHVQDMVVEERERWHAEREGLLRHLEEAWHWRQNAEDYDACLHRYYIQRAKHQQRAVRLNQVLYGHTIVSATTMMGGGEQPNHCQNHELEGGPGGPCNNDTDMELNPHGALPVRKRSFGGYDQENEYDLFKERGSSGLERPCKASRYEHAHVMRVIQ